MSSNASTLVTVAAGRRRLHPAVPAFAAGLGVAAVLMAPQAWSVWHRGTFLDPDDALRTVEIRDFLAGQPWFDMVPHRLSPDHPFAMHWSRLVDAGLGGMQRLFALGMPDRLAERAMRILAPVLFFIVALAAVLRLTARLVGNRGLLPAALILASAAEPMANFLPGHIHHHGLQAALLLAALTALIETIGNHRRSAFAALSGALAMLSLGVGLQNLPFVIGLVTAAVMLWVQDGMSRRRHLAAFGVGLCAAVPVFLLDVPPGLYREGACDAFSVAHLVAAVGAASVCLGLAGLTPWLGTAAARLGCGVSGGALVLGLVAVIDPQCLHDPMAGVDPLLKAQWLNGVGEALPLTRLIALAPGQGLVLLATLLIGGAATLFALRSAWTETASWRRSGWAVLLGLAAIGTLGTLWQVRVAASTVTLLVPGLAWLVLKVHDQAAARPRLPALFLAMLVGACGNGAGLAALAAMPLGRSSHTTPVADPATCFDPDAIRPLASLPPGLVLSTIDPGSALLAYTGHSVLAAPYHRNSDGNRISLLSLAAPPDAARNLIESARVRYLALCRASNETAETVAQHPNSLSAALMAGHIPDWLEPVGGRDGVFLIYRVMEASARMGFREPRVGDALVRSVTRPDRWPSHRAAPDDSRRRIRSSAAVGLPDRLRSSDGAGA